MASLGVGPVAIDAAIVIYFIEEHSKFLPLILPLFREADQEDANWCLRQSRCSKSWSSHTAPVIGRSPIDMKRCSPAAAAFNLLTQRAIS
jgi:hypothetical protein